MTIGRSSIHDTPDIAIADSLYSFLDQTVSRLHAKLFFNGSFFLQDLGSTNKIKKGENILEDRETTELSDGDVFTIGDTRLKFFNGLSGLR